MDNRSTDTVEDQLRTPAQRGVVRHGQIELEQADDGAGQASVWRKAKQNTGQSVSAVPSG